MEHDDNALDEALAATTPQELDALAHRFEEEHELPDSPSDVRAWAKHVTDGDRGRAQQVVEHAREREERPEVDLEQLDEPADIRAFVDSVMAGQDPREVIDTKDEE